MAQFGGWYKVPHLLKDGSLVEDCVMVNLNLKCSIIHFCKNQIYLSQIAKVPKIKSVQPKSAS